MADLVLVTVKTENGMPVNNYGQLLSSKRMLDLAANGSDCNIAYAGVFAASKILVEETYASLQSLVTPYATKTYEIATTGKNGNGKALTVMMNTDTIYRAYEDLKNKTSVTGISATNAGDLFTMPSGTVPKTGARIIFTSGTVNGISLNTTYYIIAASGQNFQVSLTRGGAAVVISADLTGLAATVWQKSIIQTIPTFGQDIVLWSTNLNMVEIQTIFNA